MISIFKANNPQNSFLLFLYGLLLKMVWFINPIMPEVQRADSRIWKDFIHFLVEWLKDMPVVFSVISFTLLFIQAISFNQILNRARLMLKPNYLPAMSFLLITSFFPSWNMLSSAMVCNTILLWVLAKLFFINTDNNPKTTLFNLGFLIAVCSVFQFYFVFLALLIFVALVLMRPFKIPEWLVILFGIFTVWYFLLGVLFLNNSIYTFSLPDWKFLIPPYHQFWDEYIILGFLLFLSFLGAGAVQSASSKQVVRVRKDWILLMAFFLLALAISFISGSSHFHYWQLIALPAAAFIGALFSSIQKKWVAASIHWVLVALVLYLQYFDNLG